MLTGEEVLDKLKSVDNALGKTQSKSNGQWKKRSIFFEIPYWQHCMLRHNLDVMHIEKNIVDSIVGTLLDIPGKTKDHAKARYDLKEMGIRKNLHPTNTKDGKRTKLAKACFSMTKGEKSIFCGVLKKTKFPDGSASNISHCVQQEERKLYGYKIHDAHFMLHYLLQIPIKSILPDHVAVPLVRLCSFFRRLCQKEISLEEIYGLESKIVETLCQLERIFSPIFFDIMVHLPIHLANEVRLGDPVQFRWMYPIERYMCTLKGYVRNRSRPEGSIAEVYLAEECLTFCLRYLHEGVKTRFNRVSQNNDEGTLTKDPDSNLFTNKGSPLGGKKGQLIILDEKSLLQANAYVLNNCVNVEPYMREHGEQQKQAKKKRKWNVVKDQNEDFIAWFTGRAMKDDVPGWIRQLSKGPNKVAKSFSAYVVNGYRFHTKRREVMRKTQNSGVTVVAETTSFASVKDKKPIKANIRYYGRIIDIVELDYYSQFKVVLFKCEWFMAEEDNYGLTYVHFKKRCYQDEPFVLASQAHQCFYVKDPYIPQKHYVMKTVPRDLFNMGLQLQFDPNIGEPHKSANSPIPLSEIGEVDLVRQGVRPIIVDVTPNKIKPKDKEIESDEFDSDAEI
ncbi:uncharacterized protein LOC107618653 isoform X3 [Arachis ipaensis]|uniref:uncharacterized protein LOC107618653 isoform X2 n=1 Tax=Arachis ipaensis TaxID=130454 RepID=UPI000A2AF3AE|nr:uncharacterized protein LOC107618653 isoform X2 [Arachis ipaensis]XP_020968057.1 uncharacterized protein LOC107618653 isoform X3 [Arachis ipaensis]